MDEKTEVIDRRELFAAIMEVQKAVKIVTKDATGNNHKYSSYPNLALAIRGPMQDNGLVFSHSATTLFGADGSVVPAMETTLFHVPSGQHLTNTTPITIPDVKSVNKTQARGMGESYQKRYNEASWFALPIGDDADEKRFNSPGNIRKHQESSMLDIPVLMDGRACLAAIEKAESKGHMTAIFKAHESKAEGDGWHDALVGLCQVRAKEFDD